MQEVKGKWKAKVEKVREELGKVLEDQKENERYVR